MLDRIDMRPDGYDLSVLSRPAEATAEFLMHRYRCPDIGVTIEPGDTVIDCGACWGDTALHAALDAGPGGEVYAFEFEPRNIDVLYKALDLNPHLKDRVEVIQLALWDESDLSLDYRANGPRSRLLPQSTGEGDAQADTITLDDFVDEQGLEKVDFIKLDIEGSEAKALRGARRTIERFRPKLAISVFFQPRLFTEVPRLLDEYAPGYRFRLGHTTMNQRGTVLYAAASRRADRCRSQGMRGTQSRVAGESGNPEPDIHQGSTSVARLLGFKTKGY